MGAFASFLAGGIGRFGELVQQDQDRQYQERKQQKQMALEMLSKYAQDPETTPEGAAKAAEMLGDMWGMPTVGRKGKKAAKGLDMPGMMKMLYAAGPTPEPAPAAPAAAPSEAIGKLPTNLSFQQPTEPTTYGAVSPISGPPSISAGPEMISIPTQPPLPGGRAKYRYAPGEREAAIDVAKMRGEEMRDAMKANLGLRVGDIATRRRIAEYERVGLLQTPAQRMSAILGKAVPEPRPGPAAVEMVNEGTGHRVAALSPEEVQRYTALGYREQAHVRAPTTHEEQLQEEIRGHMIKTGEADPKRAEAAVLSRRYSNQLLDMAVKNATIANLGSQVGFRKYQMIGAPPGLRSTADLMFRMVQGAEAKARQVAIRGTPENDTFTKNFRTKNGREPGAEDTTEAYKATFERILEESGMTPQEIQQHIIAGVGSAGTPGTQPAPPMSNWQPR